MFPVFIPSKGRAGLKGTWDKLKACDIPYTVVVEPQDYALYKKHHSTVSCLPFDDRGVDFVRNFILETLSPSSGWYWCIDDDIQHFFAIREAERKVEEVDIRTMMGLANPRDALAIQPGTCIIGIEYNQFMRNLLAHHNPYMVDSYVNICVCINRALMPRGVNHETLRYRFPIREDYDMCLQVITNGGHVFRYRCVGFAAPSMGQKPGGMTEFYKTKKNLIRECNKKMIETWGDDVCTEVVKGSGPTLRNDLSIKWRHSQEIAAGKRAREAIEGVSKRPVGWSGWTVMEDMMPDVVGLGLIPKKDVKRGDEVCLLLPKWGALSAMVIELDHSKKRRHVTVVPDPNRKDITCTTLSVFLEDIYEIPSKESGGIAGLQKALTSVEIKDVGVVPMPKLISF